MGLHKMIQILYKKWMIVYFINEFDKSIFILFIVCELDEIYYAGAESANIKRLGGVSLQGLKGAFHKELSKRPAYDKEPTVSAAALACGSHQFFGDQLGGLTCQICSFETKDRVWKCNKGCDIALCGSCMDKYKKKLR